MKLNALKKTEHIQERYRNYILSSFSFGKDELQLQSVFDSKMESEDLIKGPYVALQTPFKRAKSIDDLINDGILCKSFRKLNLTENEFSRPLYAHQERAIKIISSNRSAVVTTGTGSGKTECFLYPIINEILQEIESGNKEVGIRALFLYPMNALVNDQFDRIRNLIKGCPDITYGFFTGDTPESKLERKKIEEESENDIPVNELVTREEIRSNPPHILFTNYSMLEHLLLRPNDYCLFQAERLKNWKFVVLDEAHTYNGAKGIEISMLMRRLTACADKKPAFILTSATLGSKEKSEENIVEFAKGLTSVEFSKDDIIFADRIPFELVEPSVKIPENIYNDVSKAFPNFEKIKEVCNEYSFIQSSNSREFIYELLIRDENTLKLYDLLKESCKSFSKLYESFKNELSVDGLSNLIDLINIAEKDGKGIFELRYHSFARPIVGGFVSFGEQPHLSLHRVDKIDGMKAFEIGNCKYCHAPYIIGKIETKDDLKYLVQNDDVDIYEVYEDKNESVLLEFFLLSHPDYEDDDEESVDNKKNNMIEEYSLCPICGELHEKDNLAASSCSCNSERKKIYRVLRQDEINGKKRFTSSDNDSCSLNNIPRCPSCGHRGVNGVVRNLTMGKDASTSIIAQFLYEVIGGESVNKPQSRSLLSNKFGIASAPQNNKSNVKQFLAFSDSRQKASFATVFFDSVQKRMLRKRIIWQVIEDLNYQDIPLDVLTSKLNNIISENNLFTDRSDKTYNTRKEAWISVLRDLMQVDGDFDGEGCGLYYFDLDLSKIIAQFPDDDINGLLSDYGIENLTRKEFEVLLQVVFRIFKTSPAIDYSDSGIMPMSDEAIDNFEYQAYLRPIYEKMNAGSSDKMGKSFFPINNRPNKIMRYVMRAFNISEENTIRLLEALFTEGEDKLFSGNSPYTINASRYILKNYKTNKYYICSKCRRLTPYNLRGTCPHDRCEGRLEECDPDKVLKNNFYRNQYLNEKIEGIVIQEHTAQISRKQGREYQNDFKNKKINILSCSTTFEMGVDLGNIETVFMRNMPPTPANYIQRAGRAGRRKESSAYILTFCESKPHDYTYFKEPAEMIAGVIRPPHFDVVNFKIIERHLLAACLGFFFRMNPGFFKDINSFVLNNGIKKFYEYIENHPVDLNKYIDKVIPEDRYAEYKDFKWLDINNGMKQKVELFKDEIEEQIREYEKLKAEAVDKGKYGDAATYDRYIEHIKTGNVIDFLSDACVIPKYGFPVDVVNLAVNPKDIGKKNISSGLNLQRDLRIAISEYAPDSEVIADKKKYTSRYIVLKKGHELIKHYFCTCHKCQKINIYAGTLERCKYCNTELNAPQNEYFIDPIYGFAVGETKTAVGKKPVRAYSGKVAYIGEGKKHEIFLELFPVLKIESSSDDRLLVMNKKKFFMCPKCGYAGEAKGNIKREHKDFYGHKCPRKSNKNKQEQDTQQEIKFDYLRIAHEFRTDVARFTIPSLKLSNPKGEAEALSFLYAFLEGISESMNIDRNDIDGIVEISPIGDSWDVLIYDDVPGGAGHVKRLLNKSAVMDSLNAALRTVSKECCDEKFSCYRCLRNYKNQAYHKKLSRGLAKNIIERLLKDIKALDDVEA